MIEFFLISFFIAQAPQVTAATAAPPPPGTTAPTPGTPGKTLAPLSHPVTIQADKLEILGKQREAIWSGNVRAQRGEALLTCARLVAAYTTPEDIRRLSCGGGVKVVEGERTASGQQADFDNVAGIVELTGSPEARLGGNEMKGSRVSFDVGSDTLRVENARTVFETTPSERGPIAGAPRGFKRPVTIQSNRLEVFNNRRQATWIGNVRARHEDMRLSCDRLVATYTEAQEIKRMSCIGRVEVQNGDTWAKGERADFDAQRGTIVVTGSPEAKQGGNHLRATKVIVRLGSDTLEVENAQAILRTTPGGAPTLPKGGKP